MKSYTFDIETDGLLDQLTHVKCINVIDNETRKEYRFNDGVYHDAHSGERLDTMTGRAGSIEAGLQFLLEVDEICGHNIVGFDIPAIQKVYPEFRPSKGIFDTALISRLMYTDLAERDTIATRKGRLDLPADCKFRRHSLKAWGLRLGGELKADFNPKDFGFEWNNYPFSKECDDYCMQDVRTNVGLVDHFKKRLAETEVPAGCLELENDVARIVGRQERFGWLYDVEAAHKLTAELQKEVLALEDELRESFGDFYQKKGKLFTPKRDNAKMGYLAGVPVQHVKLVSFNPGSRDHIADRLTKLFGWVPEEFTPNGKPTVDETTLSKLDYPEAKLLVRYFTANKMLSQVATGKGAQLNYVKDDGRIHGRVTTNGAVTGRMTHSSPNVAQTDKDARVRSLYIVPPGRVLVGCDADSLELRCLAHFLARYDGGAYVKVILEGNKADGSDMHSRNQKAVELNDRDSAKTIFYAWAYGAGDYKLGTVVYDDWPEDKRARFNARFKGEARKKKLIMIGRRARAQLVAGIDGMEKLIKAVKAKAKSPGFVRGLDGRRVLIRSQHAALNTLLQSAGALVMKKALVILDNALQATGLVPGIDYEFVGNIHDELQIECEERHSHFIGQSAAAAIEAAGEHFKFRCPLSGDYDVGTNWSETH